MESQKKKTVNVFRGAGDKTILRMTESDSVFSRKRGANPRKESQEKQPVNEFIGGG